MSYTLYELAMNPEVQRKAQEEIDAGLVASNGEITEDFINKLVYLEQCIMENVRKNCPVYQLSKISLKETEFPPQYENSRDHLKITEGLNVVIPVFALHL